MHFFIKNININEFIDFKNLLIEKENVNVINEIIYRHKPT